MRKWAVLCDPESQTLLITSTNNYLVNIEGILQHVLCLFTADIGCELVHG